MKLKSLKSVLLAATFILPAGLWAEPGAVAGDAAREQRLRQADTNQDGRLDQAERRALREQRRAEGAQERQERWQERRREFDRDGDGRLNDAEHAAFEAAARAELEKRPRVMAQFDADRDGKLSDAEWKQARETLKQRRQAQRPAGAPPAGR